MAEIIRKAIAGYKFVFDEMADPRTKSWPLVARPYQGITLLALYLMFVLKWGPNLMKNRQPFNLDKIMIIYNAVQVICCGYLFFLALFNGWGPGQRYRWVCEPVDYSESEHAMLIARAVYFYYILKIADLADTIFFVLRKKFNQVSFLHLYHHTGMVAIVWAAITYYPGGHGTMIGLINSFVHCVMYTYYMLTVAFPAVKQSVRFKKFVTQIQILQFFLCIVHFGSICFKPDCEFPRWTAAVFLPQNIFMLVLFLDFYIKTYVRKPKPKNENKAEADEKSTSKMAEDNEKATQKNFDLNKEVQSGILIENVVRMRTGVVGNS